MQLDLLEYAAKTPERERAAADRAWIASSHARVLTDPGVPLMRWLAIVYERGVAHGEDLILQYQRAATPGDFTSLAFSALDSCMWHGFVVQDAQSEPTPAQRFNGMGGQAAGMRRFTHPATYWYEPQRDRARWESFPPWMRDIIFATTWGEPAPRPVAAKPSRRRGAR